MSGETCERDGKADRPVHGGGAELAKPVVIDGFCRAGGAGRGYHDAGYEVIGVDIEPQPNYPYTFFRGDALTLIPSLYGALVASGRRVALVHTSPPCEANIAITAGNRARPGWTDDHVNLIPETRVMLAGLRGRRGVPTVIENGVSDQLRPDLVLCGLMFRLPTLRDRYFEIDGFAPVQPVHPSHRGHLTIGWRHKCHRTIEPSVCPVHERWCRGTVYGVYGDGGGKPSIPEAQLALGIYHTDVREELNDAIPPAYTRYIGQQLSSDLAARAAA